ncbi:MAG: HU family DNA-binding protein [Bacteroidota bacterium]
MDIGKIITQLLYDHEAVTIPGFGGLTLRAQAAEADQLAGIIRPPSKIVSFNPNLKLNDGLLIARIQDIYNLSAEEADKVLQSFIEQLTIRLKNGETVEIEGIGQFFQSGEEVQFSTAAINYDKSTYGLPEVKSSVIAIPKGEKLTFGSPEAETTTTTVVETEETERSPIFRWAVPLIAVLTLAALIFMFKDQLFGNQNKQKENTEDQVRVNEAPIAALEEPQDTIIEEYTSKGEEQIDVESATPPPNQRVKKIVVGAFKDQTNAGKLARKIQLKGYVPFSESRNGKRYVGITYPYESDAEFRSALANIKKQFNKDAWVLQ